MQRANKPDFLRVTDVRLLLFTDTTILGLGSIARTDSEGRCLPSYSLFLGMEMLSLHIDSKQLQGPDKQRTGHQKRCGRNELS